eukprot:TRINITY_DN22562_c0_g1_i1.p1 TRINITY_DN22562_c0_g1~~TRINITY_DN22562_c0_g1_i1.p1  ORF type:complete len:139 (+),score=33.96 TRINITY_DN22562_c0_g1_i1:60-419(+)
MCIRDSYDENGVRRNFFYLIQYVENVFLNFVNIIKKGQPPTDKELKLLNDIRSQFVNSEQACSVFAGLMNDLAKTEINNIKQIVVLTECIYIVMLGIFVISSYITVSYTHLTLPTIYSV